jgi:hypothetical protein
MGQNLQFKDGAVLSAAAHFARWASLTIEFLGFRCAPPQALCSCPLGGLKAMLSLTDFFKASF